MESSSNLPIILLIFLIASSLPAVSLSLEDVDCVYSLFIRTGSEDESGTDSNITMTLADGAGNSVNFGNLVVWGGAMGPGYNYFEKENLDIFAGTAECLAPPPWKMKFALHGKSFNSKWYCVYVKVIMNRFNGPSQLQDFIVERWVLPSTNLTVEAAALRTPKKAGHETFGSRKAVSSIVSA